MRASRDTRRTARWGTARWGTAWWAATLARWWVVVRTFWVELRRDGERGYSTETVVVTALLVVLALTVLGIIATAVTAKANSIVF